MERHPSLAWSMAEAHLKQHPEVHDALRFMEESGGEPDFIGNMQEDGSLLICDCAKETPAGRRSLCYDESARAARKKNPASGSAMKQAEEAGITLMDEKTYLYLQSFGEYDLKTSSWILTPQEIREKGGALFCERRYGRTFTFHNGADSWYSVRGWRGFLKI